MPGGRGHSVFAYRSEIDTWLKATPPAGLAETAHDAKANSDLREARRWQRLTTPAYLRVASVLVILFVAGFAWRARTTGADSGPLSYGVAGNTIVAAGRGGGERWRFDLPASERVRAIRTPPEISLADDAGALIGIDRMLRSTMMPLSGQLLWLSPQGQLQRTFAYERQLTFGAGAYGEPWILSDFDVREAGTRAIAVAGRHNEWWPSFLTILNDKWQPGPTFVNAGWIEEVRWVTPSRLIVSGFANAPNGGMVALLDANALDGQSPFAEDEHYGCLGCGPGRPLRYVILPRTEINEVTASPYNGAKLFVSGNRVLVRTMEMRLETGQVPEVLYEFTRSLDLVRASFGDRYWDMHKALESEEKIRHTREACPDRDGPRPIEIWEPSSGWRTVAVR